MPKTRSVSHPASDRPLDRIDRRLLARLQQDGRAPVSQLAPGEYQILAVDNPDELEYANPEAVRRYLSKARDVSLAPNQKGKVELEVIRIGD